MKKGKHLANSKIKVQDTMSVEERVEIKKRAKIVKKKKKEKHRRHLVKIFAILFIISVIYIGNSFFNSQKEEAETDELLNTIVISNAVNEEEEQDSEMVIKVKELRKQYPEVIGWLEIEGTNINYPVMQTNNNDFYMTHNYKKEYSKDGALFLDKAYDWSKPSTNLLIYGHNNIGSSEMFVELLKYKKEDFYKEHKIIKFTTTSEEAEYEIIAVFKSRVYYSHEQNVFRYYYFIDAKNEAEFNNYVSNAKNASMYNIDASAKYGDSLMTLSTCEYSQKDGRFAVVARKIVNQ